jgi:5,10-methylenetetrahydromethanopterin reductase
MRYGLLLLGEHAPERLRNLARFAEEHGFDHLWYADEKFYRDPYVSLTYVAQHTSRITLGTCVTDPYTRHPALTAMAMGSLAELAGGRAVLGIGAGFSGLQAMGIKQTTPTTALREAIDLIRQLWAGGPVTYLRDTVKFHGGELNFTPPSKIPVLMATSGRRILQLAGEIADGVMLGDLASPRVIAPALAEVTRGAHRAGRSLADVLPLISRANLIIAEDPAEARRPMRPWIAIGLWHMYPRWDYYFNYTPAWHERLRPIEEFIQRQGGKPRNVGDFNLIAAHADLIGDDLVRDAGLAGTVDDVVRQIVEIAGTGITHLTLYPVPVGRQTIESVLETFVTDVVPAVHAALERRAAEPSARGG